MNVNIYLKDNMAQYLEGVDQIKENHEDIEVYKYDWKDELFCTNRYKKSEIAQMTIR